MNDVTLSSPPQTHHTHHFFSTSSTSIAQITTTMKLSLALATLAIGSTSAFSTQNGGVRKSMQLNMRQPVMAGNWKVRTHIMK